MLKVTPELYNFALDKGYAEVFAEVEGITIAVNDSAEEIEDWLRNEKNIVCRIHPLSTAVFIPELRILTEYGSVTIPFMGKKGNRSFRDYNKARAMAIKMALNKL